MNENEAKHLQALIRAKKERLHQLELKEARYGLDVPPHIPIEIEELRGEIKALQTQLAGLEKEQRAASRLEEARRQVPALAKPRRPVNWERVGAIVGVIAVLIAMGAWLVPNARDFLVTWLSEPPTVTPTSSPTHTPVISAATPTHTPFPPTATPTFTPVPATPTSEPVAGATMVWEKDGSIMVYVPAGEFIMGSAEGDSDEQPMHTIRLDAFYIDKTEVTNAQFAQFLNEQGNQEEGGVTWLDIGDEDYLISQSGDQYQPKSGYEDHPVIEVNWYGARAYCQWAGKRLPTEAEWEKAARGTDGRVYPWGNEWDENKLNSWEGGPHDTTAVGSYPAGASPYGALDMAGNVWEWVADWYDSGYYSQSPNRNPSGPDSGEVRVLRGGSWYHAAGNVRCASRIRYSPDVTYYFVGFRCARGSP